MVIWLCYFESKDGQTITAVEACNREAADFIVARRKRDGGEKRQNRESITHQLIDS